MNSESLESLECLEGPEGFNIVVNQPSLSVDGPKSNKPWKYLSKFQVTCQGLEKVRCPVYANGRQQIPIQINIEARDEDGVVVDVNHGRLYLNLVLYDDVEAFPSGLGRSGTEDPRFIYQWTTENLLATAGESEHESVPSEGVESIQTVKQFVTANKVGTYKLGARCRSPGWVLFTTNTPNPPEGKFDSWVLVDARQPVAIGWDKFAITSPRDAHNSGPLDVDLYYVYFNDKDNTALRIVDSIHYSAAPDTCHYAWIKGSFRMEQAAFRALHKRLVTYSSCGYSATFFVGERSGAADVGRIRNSNGKPCGNMSYHHGLVGYINQYGNESKVVIRASSDGNTISLGNPSRPDDSAPPVDEEAGSADA
ncbi:hypothetical protein [Stenotrophomonas rhizophila]|uniref:hypothetical protein n=1 Tax=Stenotrophomonas rhizophila TaxID=216778 RepID=UPI0011A6A43D|nr:hypothetical protein [Stenotrophomonas rhizophila]